MKNLKKLLVITIFSLIFQIGVMSVVQGQNIGINEPNPDNSAILEMTSTERGLLIPRMTTVQRDAIDLTGNPQSVIIFNTDVLCFQTYVDGIWQDIWCYTPPPPFTCGTSTVTFDYKGSSVTYGTVVGQNSTCWLDRNLGAEQQATAYNDYLAYGDLFQWGRFDHDYQDITWTNSTTGTPVNGTTTTNADNPANALFITSPYDWRVNQDNNLWNGVNAANNPCPSGWRIPTETELNNERASWGSQNYNGAYASPLKLVVVGDRSETDGTLHNAGNCSYYWSSTVDGVSARILYFDPGSATMYSNYRARGFSVRCIKD